MSNPKFRCNNCDEITVHTPAGHCWRCGLSNEEWWLAQKDDSGGSKAPDPVEHPAHYTAHPSGVECIQITEHLNFCIGNAVKYLWRADMKGGIEDLRKAAWYIEREIARRSA